MLYYEQQIIIGSIIAGSSLIKPKKGKNFYLSMRSKNEKWLEYKAAMLQSSFSKFYFSCNKKTFRCNSETNECLNELHLISYEDSKKRLLSMETFDQLRDIAFAVWYLDSGSKTGRNKKNYYLNSTKLGKNGSKIALDFFNEVGLPCSLSTNKNRSRITFSVDGSKEFHRMIEHRVPEFMLYRL